MTTIAVKDGKIAADSRGTLGNVISFKDFDKICRFNSDQFGDVYIGFAGAVNHIAEAQQFLSDLFSGNPTEDIKFDGSQMVMLMMDESGTVYEGMLTEASTDISWLICETPYSVGSGSQIALGAMAAGCSAEDAVKIAGQLDCFSDQNVKVYSREELSRKHKLKAQIEAAQAELQAMEDEECAEDLQKVGEFLEEESTEELPDDGWIDYAPDESVATPDAELGNTLIEVKFRDGSIRGPVPATVVEWDWLYEADDVVAYKIVKD